MDKVENTPVLIVGGGPVGLSMAILLGRNNQPFILIDSKPGTSDHPAAGYHNLRSAELYRQWGVADAFLKNGFAAQSYPSVVWSTRLLGGYRLGEIVLTRNDLSGEAAISPAEPMFCSQDQCEPILREQAERAPVADIRFGCELISLAQDDNGVTARVRRIEDGETSEIRAQYLVGADGAHSTVAKLADFEIRGMGVLGHCANIHFRAPGILDRLGDTKASMYCIANAEVQGVWGTMDESDRWLLNIGIGEHTRATLDQLTNEKCEHLVRSAAGDPDLEVDILSARPWTMKSQLADNYRSGRILLIGDAAHQFPPTAGFGMNTGVQDAHNLAWKLVSVLRGEAGEGLLDTYSEERRAIADANLQWSVANAKAMVEGGFMFENGSPELLVLEDEERGMARRRSMSDSIPEQHAQFDAMGMALGFTYESGALIPDGTDKAVVANPISDYAPSGRPGARAPHVWLLRDGERISILDLFDLNFALLIKGKNSVWSTAAAQSAAELGVKLDVYTIGGDGCDLIDPNGSWPGLYGLNPGGAVLVRPDGHVAWRTVAPSSDGDSRFRSALASLLCRSDAD